MIILRWNGWESETTEDYFSHIVDFEGYRVYMGRTLRLNDFALLASRDQVNYVRKMAWLLKLEGAYGTTATGGDARWHVVEPKEGSRQDRIDYWIKRLTAKLGYDPRCLRRKVLVSPTRSKTLEVVRWSTYFRLLYFLR